MAARIAATGRTHALAGVDVEALYDEFEYMDLDRQRALVASAFESITIKPRGRGRVAPKAEHIVMEVSREWKA